MNWRSFNWPKGKWFEFIGKVDTFTGYSLPTVDCRPQTVLRFRCAYCGTIRRITEAGVSELKSRSAWKCETCASTSLEFQREEKPRT